MKDVWKEIWNGLDGKVLIVTFLSVALIALLAYALNVSLRKDLVHQVESNILNSELQNLKQTLLHE